MASERRLRACQCAPPGLAKVLPQWAQGLSEYTVSREHLPQSMRLAHAPRDAAGQSESSWHTAHLGRWWSGDEMAHGTPGVWWGGGVGLE